MRLSRSIALPLIAGSLLALPVTASGSEGGPFERLLAPYHQARTALVHDDLAEATDQGQVIEGRARAALADPQSSAPESSDRTVLIEEIAAAAAELGSASDLDTAREAFFALSKPMGRLRKLVGDDSTVVAYCPMEKKAWLQPDGEIQNPYGGQAMPRCGQKIPD